MQRFCYYEPKTIEEACSLLSQFGEDAKVLAGGTDLIPRMGHGLMAPTHIVNIKRVRDLNSIIEEAGNGLRIGALITLAELARNPVIRDRFPMIHTAANSIGSLQVRNLATLGGNLCNAAPSADMAPALLALESTVNIAGLKGQRKIPLEEFFRGPGEVNLTKGEILTEIHVPFPPPHARQVYVKHSVRRSMDIALVGVAVCLCLDKKTGLCNEARIALGAVAPTPIRARETEKMILGKTLREIPLPSIGEVVSSEASPISDVRGSARYRSEMVSSLTIRALKSLRSKV
jgi:carbon-monoxide dehydrogenase medium subunit